jgi:SAM-dependent methyltransferase
MPRYEPFDWYEDARYYDIVFDADTRREMAFLEAVQERHGLRRGRHMLEPACGSGRLVAAAAARGYRVTGFDISEGMLRFARRRLRARSLNARLIKARMEDFSFAGKFDIAHCLISTFKYLLSEEAAVGHLRCMAASLKPGGVYVLGLHLTDYADRTCSHERWVARRGGEEVICNIRSWPPDRRRRTERVRSRLIVRRQGRQRRLETQWTFRTYGLGQLRSLLRSVPQLEHVATHDFHCDIERPIAFDGRQLDNVLILRRV